MSSSDATQKNDRDARSLVACWFACWESGDIEQLPVTEDFCHTSPFGKIEGKEAYLALVNNNREKFLNHKFDIIDAMYEPQKACIRYLAKQPDFQLAVTEWHYCSDGLIREIVAYYHIGDIRKDRQLQTQD